MQIQSLQGPNHWEHARTGRTDYNLSKNMIERLPSSRVRSLGQMKPSQTCMWRKKGTAQDPKDHIMSQTWWSHYGMDTYHWFLLMIVTVDRSSRVNSEVYRSVLSAHIQPKATKLTGQHLRVLMDNDPKHTAKETLDILKALK